MFYFRLLFLTTSFIRTFIQFGAMNQYYTMWAKFKYSKSNTFIMQEYEIYCFNKKNEISVYENETHSSESCRVFK